MISNINLNNVSINQTADNSGISTYIGTLVGLGNTATIKNSFVTNPFITVSGTNYGENGSRGYYDIGGLVGAIFGGSISNSSSAGGAITNNVNTNTNNNMIAFNEVGGFLGGEHNGAALNNDFSSTAITSTGYVNAAGSGSIAELIVGGLLGRLDTTSTANNTYSTGAVNVTTTLSTPLGTGYVLIGGLMGVTSISNNPSPTPPADINNSYSTSAVTLHITLNNSAPGAANIIVGGLLGQSSAILDNSYSTGPIAITLASDSTASNESLYVGGLAGDSFTAIQNSYSNSPVTISGNNYGNQLAIGGFVGGNITLYDKELSESYSSGLINIAVNNYMAGQILVGGYVGLNIYYGNPPPARLPFSNDYSTNILNISGVNDASTTIIGGFVGANGLDGNNPGGDIINSYNTGFINNNTTTINGGITLAGGFLGQTIDGSDPLSPPIVLTSNFYDTGTTGFNQNQGVGNIPGSVTGIIPGCFGGGMCPNGGSADLSSEVTYNTAGWNFVSTWGIVNNGSYPYLLNSNPLPPQVISGMTPAGGGTTVNLVTNGQIIATTLTGPNGFYYFFEPNGTIASNQLGLVYLTGSSIVGNTIFAPAPDGNSSGSSISNNTIQVGSNSALSIENSDLINLLGSLSDTNILYSGLGLAVTVGTNTHPNIDFITMPYTTYLLNGELNNITSGTGNDTFNGTVILTANSSINSNTIQFMNTLSGANYSLALTSQGDTGFYNTVLLHDLISVGNRINIMTSSIATSGNQYYGELVNLAQDTTFTANDITFNNGIVGNNNLNLVGQSLNNNFVIKGSLLLNNIKIVGNSSAVNLLNLDVNHMETWNIILVMLMIPLVLRGFKNLLVNQVLIMLIS